MTRKLAIDQLRYVVYKQRFPNGKRPKRSKAADHSSQPLEVWIRQLLDRDFPPEVIAQRAVIRGGNRGVPISSEEARQLVAKLLREDK